MVVMGHGQSKEAQITLCTISKSWITWLFSLTIAVLFNKIMKLKTKLKYMNRKDKATDKPGKQLNLFYSVWLFQPLT